MTGCRCDKVCLPQALLTSSLRLLTKILWHLRPDSSRNCPVPLHHGILGRFTLISRSSHVFAREGGLDGNWVLLFPYSLSTLPPFPSMSNYIQLLYKGTSHPGRPMGHCADELNRLVNHPTHQAQLGCRHCGALSSARHRIARLFGFVFGCVFSFEIMHNCD